MLGLPKSTEMKKQLPKTAIYVKFAMNAAAKDKFDADISRLTIVNEISKATCAIAAGENVSSFYVLLVSLKRKEYSEATIAQIAKLINQNMLLILEYEDNAKLAIYRTKLITTNWKPKCNLSIKLKGLNLDTVWDNIVKGIEGGDWNDALSVEENLSAHEQIEQLQKQIAVLEKKARAEKQPKRKFELVQQIKILEIELKAGDRI